MDYQKLEVRVFEMEAEITEMDAEITSLNEALTTTTEEKEAACTENGVLQLLLDSVTNKFNAADLQINFLKEDIIKMEQRLCESESLSMSLKTSIDLLTGEKEEMGMQLADALLEMEVEKSTWVSKEKAFNKSNEMIKLSNNQITSLSKDLLEVRHELESLREQHRLQKEMLTSAEENAEREKERSHAILSDNAQLGNELEHVKADRGKYEEACSILKVQTLEYNGACEDLKKVQGQLQSVIQERDDLLLQVKLERGLDTSNDYQENLISNKEKTKLRMQLRSTQAKLDALRVRYKELVDEKTLMKKKFEEASINYKEKLRWYGSQLLEAQKQLFNRS